MDPLTLLLIAGGSALISGVGDWMNRNQAQKAAEATATAQQTAIDENQTALTAQFEEFKSLMNPYAEAGAAAQLNKDDLMGLNGTEAQQAAVDAIANNPQLQEQMLQGENAMRQNASATGGLRGGNFQGALAQYRPGMVNAAIDQRYEQLNGTIGTGLNASSAIANMGMNVTGQMGNMNLTEAGIQGMLDGMPTAGQNFGASLMAGLGNGLGTYAGLGGTFGIGDLKPTLDPATAAAMASAQGGLSTTERFRLQNAGGIPWQNNSYPFGGNY